jgi:hypothetical protein
MGMAFTPGARPKNEQINIHIMEYYNNTLCIEAGWLVENDIIKADNYGRLAQRKQLNVVRRACLNTPALVQFDSMPERFKTAIKERIGGDPYKLVVVNQVSEKIVANEKATEFFETYKLSDGRFLPANVRREYYANAIVLDAIHALINNKKAKRSALGHKSVRMWDQYAEAVQELDRSKYPHSLPANPRSLENKYKAYVKDGVEVLIHKNYNNKNSAKVNDEVKEAFIIELLADPRNLDNAQVMSLYNMIAENMKWKKITGGAVAVWREKYDTQIYAGRRGSVAFSNQKTMQIKRSAPTAPLYYLTMDGWDVELMYQMTETKPKTGYSTTTYHHRPTVVVILDAFNKYILGYAIGTHETPELITEALRDASRHTTELFGTMHRAHQLQSDRYAIKKLTPFYEALAKLSVPAKAKNAKAKIIEPYFRSLNHDYCQMQRNWSGWGITSGKDKQPNIEYLNKYKKDFPDWDGVCAQVMEMIEMKRDEKREEYLTKWAEMEQADKLVFEPERYLLTFGQKTGFRNLMTGSGLHVTINGIKRDYDCFDTAFRNYASVRWEVRYDPYDPIHILAVNEDESLQFLLEEKYVQPMALKDRKAGDSGQIQRVKDFNYSLEKQVTDFRARQIEAVAVTLMLPQMQNETLKKLMLTDSRGQHKNQRNAPPRPQETRHATSLQKNATTVEIENENELEMYDLY